ncbi:PH-domain-containing protein [Clavulina sp. PMI_390]|nr:PH-domain-containing protein [Clavulina sp. PMI_390]
MCAHLSPSCVPEAAAPPTPQEVQRKLSLNPTVSLTSLSQQTTPGLSSAESDSDGPSGSYFSPPRTTAAVELSSSQPPLNTITEKLNASGEESDDDDEMGQEWQPGSNATPQGHEDHNHNDVVIKSGYLWKKGERRKTWKKRWFVLRTSKLALYKSSQEYVLLRILDMHDVHSTSVVSLKKHVNTFGVVTPNRTYYLQAEDLATCNDWVRTLNEVRNRLREEDRTPQDQTPRHSITALPNAIPNSSTLAARRSSMQPAGTAPALPSIVTSSPTPGSTPMREFKNRGASATAPPQVAPPEDPPLDPNHVVMSGYLMKCGSKRKTWHKRWFMLTSDRLAYSKSHIDTKHTKQVALAKVVDAIEFTPPAKHGRDSSDAGGSSGMSSLNGAAGFGTSSQPRNTFKIITTQRPFLLSAPSEEEEIQWLSAVRALIARRGGPTA